jgi:putative hydrolase of the HAD superfamily
MPANQPIVLFDLFGVIAKQQRPGALAQMAACCDTPTETFTKAYWDLRQPYDAGRQSAPEYWTAVLRLLSRPTDPGTIEKLRLTDIDSWSRVDRRMVAFTQSLRSRATVAVLSNIPADHADAFLAAQPWMRNLDYLAFSGKIKAAKPDPAAFQHCINALHATPADFLFIDDREENVLAAQANGMAGHVFTGLGDLVKVINTWLAVGVKIGAPAVSQR